MDATINALPSADELMGLVDTETPDEETVSARIVEDYAPAKPYRDEGFSSWVLERYDQWMREVDESPYGSVLWQSYCTYHMLSENAGTESVPHTRAMVGGENDEFVLMDVPHYRNLINQAANLITSDKLAFTPQASNSNGKSMEQVRVAQHVIDHVLYRRKLGRKLRKALKTNMVAGVGYVMQQWDSYTGTPTPDGFSGDIRVTEHSPWEVVHEDVRDYEDASWHIVRDFANRHDMAARLRNKGDHDTAMKVLAQSYGEQDYQFTLPESGLYSGCDAIPVYVFWHNRTAAVPMGRYAGITGDGLVLWDGPLPFPRATVRRMCSSEFIGTARPFSDQWMVLALQEMYNAILSPLLSRIDAFGNPIIDAPEGGNWTLDHLQGFRFHERPAGSDSLMVHDFSQISPTVPQTLDLVNRLMERLTSINSVVQGQPAENIGSGTYAALIHAQAVKAMNDPEESYVDTCGDTVMDSLQLYQSMASEDLLIAITGDDGEPGVMAFKGEAISEIKSVHVERSDPAMRTTSAKQEMASVMVANGLVKTPEEYLAVVKTGTFESLFTNATKAMASIREENSMMLRGEKPQANELELHHLHVKEHAALIDSYAKENPQIAAAVQAHIAEHMKIWMKLSMENEPMLAALSVPPLPPPAAVKMAMAAAGMGQGGGGPPQGGGGPPGPAPKQGPTPGVDNKAKQPSQANIPEPATAPGEG